MNVTLSTRRARIPESVRARTADRVRRLRRYDPRILAAEVEFDRENERYSVVIRLDLARAPAVYARGASDKPGKAVAHVIERLRRQLKRNRERARDHRADPGFKVAAG